MGVSCGVGFEYVSSDIDLSNVSINLGSYDAANDTNEILLNSINKRKGNYMFVISQANITTDNLGIVHPEDKIEYTGEKWVNVTVHNPEKTLLHIASSSQEEKNAITAYNGEIVWMEDNVNKKDGFFQLNGQSITRDDSIYLSDRFANGSQTFNLPDWRGRVLVCASDDKTLGEFRGNDYHTNTISEMARHTHSGDDYATGSGQNADDPDWLSGTVYAIGTLNYTSNNTNEAGDSEPYSIEQSSVVAGYPYIYGG